MELLQVLSLTAPFRPSCLLLFLILTFAIDCCWVTSSPLSPLYQPDTYYYYYCARLLSYFDLTSSISCHYSIRPSLVI